MKPSPLLLLLLAALPCLLLAHFSSARVHLGMASDECGPAYENRSCTADLCCSTHGHCGSTYDWCAPGHCQVGYGKCWDHVPPPPPPPPSPPPPYAPDECGPKFGGRSCPSDTCCSTSGHCGLGYAWCAPGQCLPGYGTCWETVPPPPPGSDVIGEEDSMVRKVFDKMENLNKF